MDSRTLGRTSILCIALLLILLPGSGSASPLRFWPPVVRSSGLTVPVASGVEYSHFAVATTAGPLNIHHLRLDLGNATVRVGMGLASDRLMSVDETVSSMARRSRAIAGVNGDYFDIHESGMPLNIVVKDGQLLRSPVARVALAIDADGGARIVRFRWTGSIVLSATGESYFLAGYNTGLVSDGLVAVSNIRGYGAPVPDPGTRQAVVELTPADDPAAHPFISPAQAGVLPATLETANYLVKGVWPQQAYYAPFPGDALIVIGRGPAADWLLQKMVPGVPVQVNLTTAPTWRGLQMAIGGGPLLLQDGEVVEDPYTPAPGERDRRSPVAAVGIGQDRRTMMLVEVDGRQPRLSIGLTRPQLATYLQRLGAFQAMAFDSGGSATMVVRLPGQRVPRVVNSPSDGVERPVGNALLVYTTAVPGPASRLLVNTGQPLRMLTGATLSLGVIGVDAQGNPVPLPAPIKIMAPSRLITVTSGNLLRAGPTPGTGLVQVESGPAGGQARISVASRLSHLVVAPERVAVAPRTKRALSLRGIDADGYPVILPDRAASWAVTPRWLGVVSAGGEFVAGGRRGTGTIMVRLGGAVSTARVTVGRPGR